MDGTLDRAVEQQKRTIVPNNYQNIHLTPQISKTIEKFIGYMFTRIMSLTVCVGTNQFVYQKARGHETHWLSWC